jgi:hypothetical protein
MRRPLANERAKTLRTVLLTLVLTLSVLAGCSSRGLVASPDGSVAPDVPPTQCQARTTDHASVSIQVADGRTLSCATRGGDGGIAEAPPTVFRGKIASAEADAVVLDLCEGGQPCVPNGLRIVIGARGIDLRPMPHVWAKVRFQQDAFWGCHQALEVTTDDASDGSPAVEAPGQLLLAVGDGREPITAAPYEMKRVRLGCASERGCGAIAPDEYFFEVSAVGSAPPSRVYMGQTLDWQGFGRRFAVRNLRSFQSTYCDDYWNFAYYIAPT